MIWLYFIANVMILEACWTWLFTALDTQNKTLKVTDEKNLMYDDKDSESIMASSFLYYY